MTVAEEVPIKQERLNAYFDRNAIDAVVLSKVANFAWATA